MPLLAPHDLPLRVGRDQRLLGLDVGTKTIGLALSDVSRTIASPLSTIGRRKFARDAAQVFDAVDLHDVGGLVLGWPVSMDGTEGPRCQSLRQFALNVLALRDMPLIFWDERLSTQAVTRALIAADASRQRRAQLVDKLAATYILQGALDALPRSAGWEPV